MEKNICDNCKYEQEAEQNPNVVCDAHGHTKPEQTEREHEHVGDIRYCVGKNTYCTECVPPMNATDNAEAILNLIKNSGVEQEK